MARLNRQLIPADLGGYHIISRVTGGDFFLQESEKEYFLGLLRRFAAGYFVKIHSFAIMSNHFHLLVTIDEVAANNADADELASRLWCISKGEFSSLGNRLDEKQKILKHSMLQSVGMEKTRSKLGSVSCFVQDLKQHFTRYFNAKYQRFGCFWSGRFKGVIVSHGSAQLACSAYIDLNPVRAGMVTNSEDYRWCTLGLIKSSPEIAKSLLSPTFIASETSSPWDWYRSFVRESGNQDTTSKSLIKTAHEDHRVDDEANRNSVNIVSIQGARTIVEAVRTIVESPQSPNDQVSCIAKNAKEKCISLGLNGRLIKRISNMSSGIAIGSSQLIELVQRNLQRRLKPPKELWLNTHFFTTHLL